MSIKKPVISLLKTLSKKLTRKQIAESTGISERTQRRYLAGEIPVKSKHTATINNLVENRRFITTQKKKETLQKALHSYTRSEIKGTFKTVLKPSKIYEFREIPLDVSLNEFRSTEFLMGLRNEIKNGINKEKQFTSIKFYIQIREKDTGKVLMTLTVRSKTDQTVNIEKILTDSISRVFKVKVDSYIGEVFIDSVKIYQFSFETK
ncbi:MAG: hypothetical protein ACW972_02050 [Promethearchaeota archaeon]|jgi:transcriptional regulator with XRE-family HTH domain